MKHIMKKTIVLCSALLAVLLILTACQTNVNDPSGTTQNTKQTNAVPVDTSKTTKPAPLDTTSSESDEKKTVTATTSFIADMVTQLVKDKVNLEMVIPAGEDPHLYVAQPQDLKKFEKADLVLYHGLHFEGKMQDVLEQKGVAVSKNFSKEDLGVMDEDGVEIIDPHFWFDLKLYAQAVDVAAEELAKLLPTEADAIKANAESYKQELKKLDEDNKKKLEEIPEEHRYLVTPHDAFNYFSRSYNIKVVAPQGVSTDSEVATADIEETVNFIVEHKIKAIFSESTTNPERMKKLQESCAAKGWEVKVVEGEGRELFSDSLAPKGQSGDTFISMYKHNVDLIYENLK